MTDFHKKYPNLFQEVTWSCGPTEARFLILEDPPPSQLIANVNLVPRLDDQWIVLRHEDGSWDLPGGTLEKGEGYMDTLQRELLEEAGAKLVSFSFFGAWHCTSLASKPYRPHLPHPEYYRIVGVGQIEIIQSPTNPPGGEVIVTVEPVSLEGACKRFESTGRSDLAELYQLAWEISNNDLVKYRRKTK